MRSTLTIERSDWQLVGHFGVDAGIVWIGDPCYILHKEPKNLPKTLGTDWGDFCNKLGDDTTVFGYRSDQTEGLGIVCQTGYGDGSYPVYVRKEDGVVVAIFIDFNGILNDPDEDDEEPGTRYCFECDAELEDDECVNRNCEECSDYEEEEDYDE